jgi:hypothetical protein
MGYGLCSFATRAAKAGGKPKATGLKVAPKLVTVKTGFTFLQVIFKPLPVNKWRGGEKPPLTGFVPPVFF